LTPQPPCSNQSELREHWRTVLACGVGVGAGTTGIPFYTLGIFVQPLGEQFGWSRSEVQGMFTVFAIAGLFTIPLIGWATDQYGSRRVALIALIGTCIGYLCLSLFTHSLVSFYAAAGCLGVLGAGTNPISWTKVIGHWFDRQRGLALGLALAGTGLAGLVAPKYVSWIVDGLGWRAAYLGLAIIPIAAFVVVYFLLEKEKTKQSAKITDTSTDKSTGLTLVQASHQYQFWLLVFAFLLVSIAIGGTIPNLFPLLIDASISKADAASVLGLLGLSVILGRVIAGFFLDKYWAPAVAAFMLLLPSISTIIFAQATLSMPDIILGIVLIGIAAGAEFDLIAYLVSRYFGLRHYGKIYSMLYATFVFGSGIAPPIFAYFHDLHGSYNLVMTSATVLFISGATSLLLLGRYPKFN